MVATPALLLESSKILAMIYHRVKPSVLIFYSLALAFAVVCFAKSQQAQVELDRDGFVYWHNAWHM